MQLLSSLYARVTQCLYRARYYMLFREFTYRISFLKK